MNKSLLRTIRAISRNIGNGRLQYDSIVSAQKVYQLPVPNEETGEDFTLIQVPMKVFKHSEGTPKYHEKRLKKLCKGLTAKETFKAINDYVAQATAALNKPEEVEEDAE